jgi:hypothetical protein
MLSSTEVDSNISANNSPGKEIHSLDDLKEIFDTSKAAKFIISMEVKGNYHEMQ